MHIFTSNIIFYQLWTFIQINFCIPIIINEGCTDSEADNYNENANLDDGSCTYTTYGCTNELAVNYDPNAVEDDGSCIILGCTDENAINYNMEATMDDRYDRWFEIKKRLYSW